jgi:5'-3' exonuclease
MKQYNTLIIDSMNLAYRNYYKVPYMSNNLGNDTNVIYGFLRSLNNLYNRYRPDNILLAWDNRYSKRRDLFPNYKVKRREIEDPSFPMFLEQILKLKRALPEIGIPSYELDKLEADDVISILIRKNRELIRSTSAICSLHRPTAVFEKPKRVKSSLKGIAKAKIGYSSLIVSCDNDLLQLLDDDVDILHNNNEIYTKKMFIRDHNFNPRLWAVYKAIAGCKTDCVPGIIGMGDKKTKKLMKEENYDFNSICKNIHDKGQTEVFDKTLRLVVLPFDMNYDVGLKEIISININEKKLLDFLYENNINKISVKDFIRRQ